MTDHDKELRDILAKMLVDGQNQIHDLRDGKATPEEVTERMFASLDYWQPKVELLITTDRERAYKEGYDAGRNSRRPISSGNKTYGAGA